MFGRRALALALAPAVWLAGVPLAGLPGASVVGVGEAQAAEDGVRLAILPLRVEGEISEADLQDLTRALVTGFERGSFVVVAPEQVVAEAGDPGACRDAACITGVADKTRSAYVAVPQVRVNDRDYAIEVGLFNGESGERVASSEDACEICGVVDASGLLDSAAATLSLKLDALAKGPASLSLTTTPTGAVVLVDGELIGTAPFDQPIPPGKHVIRISQDGYIPIEREVTFVEGVREELSVELEKMPSALPGRGWGWASLSLGVVSLGGAGFLTFLHDRPYRIGGACSVMAPDPDFNVMNDPSGNEVCRHLWNTKWEGLALGIAGAALTTLGVLVLIDNYKRSDRSRRKAVKEKRSARFGVGPGSVLLQGRF